MRSAFIANSLNTPFKLVDFIKSLFNSEIIEFNPTDTFTISDPKNSSIDVS